MLVRGWSDSGGGSRRVRGGGGGGCGKFGVVNWAVGAEGGTEGGGGSPHVRFEYSRVGGAGAASGLAAPCRGGRATLARSCGPCAVRSFRASWWRPGGARRLIVSLMRADHLWSSALIVGGCLLPSSPTPCRRTHAPAWLPFRVVGDDLRGSRVPFFPLCCVPLAVPPSPPRTRRAGRSRGTTMCPGVTTATIIDAAATAVGGEAGGWLPCEGEAVSEGGGRIGGMDARDAGGGRGETQGCRLWRLQHWLVYQAHPPTDSPSISPPVNTPPAPSSPPLRPPPRPTRAPSARRRQTASSAQSQTAPQPPPTRARPSLGRGPGPTGSSARPTAPPSSRGRWLPPAAG